MSLAVAAKFYFAAWLAVVLLSIRANARVPQCSEGYSEMQSIINRCDRNNNARWSGESEMCGRSTVE